jgi:hypothetical protein
MKALPPHTFTRVQRLRGMFAGIAKKGYVKSGLRRQVRSAGHILKPGPHLTRLRVKTHNNYHLHQQSQWWAGQLTQQAKKQGIPVNKFHVKETSPGDFKYTRDPQSMHITVKDMPLRYRKMHQKLTTRSFQRVVFPAAATYLVGAGIGSYKYGEHFGKKPHYRRGKKIPLHVATVAGPIGIMGFKAGQKKSRVKRLRT